MKGFLRLIVGGVILGLFIFIFTQAALAAPDLEVKANNVRVSSDEIRAMCEKTVNISVYDNNHETQTVYVNSKKAKSVTGSVYDWELSYSLSTGKNSIEIVANGTSGSKTFNFVVMYVTSLVPELEYSVLSLPASGKIEAFNKALTITFPKNNILVDSDNNLWTGDQCIYFKTVTPSGKPDVFHTFASPNLSVVFKIYVDYGARLLQPGLITLTYSPDISSTISDQLAIWYSPDNDWDDNDNRLLGGLINSGKHTVTAPFQFDGERDDDRTVGYYAVVLGQKEFQEFTGTDGAGVAWSFSCVIPLWAKGIAEANDQGPSAGTRNAVNTVDVGYFGLVNDDNSKKNMTRLEFSTMMVKGLGLTLAERPSSGDETFYDVDRGDNPDDSGYFGSRYSSAFNYYAPWLIQYVETAARNGIVAGYPGGAFKPAGELTRTEAAVILARVSNLKLNTDDEQVNKDLVKIFEDADSIPLWAASSVLAAQKAKLIVGMPGSDSKKLKFSPDDKLSRAEAITLTYRLLKKLKKI